MMVVTILLIVTFQGYYIKKLYASEWNDLKKETNLLFRETVYKLQVSRFKNDTSFIRNLATDDLFNVQAINVIKNQKKKLVDKKTNTIYSTRVLEKNGNKYSYTVNSMNGNAAVTDATFVFDKKKYPGVEEVDLR